MQEGKGDDGVDVEHHQTEDGHPQQGNACMWREERHSLGVHSNYNACTLVYTVE